jgi:hypothetical protein
VASAPKEPSTGYLVVLPREVVDTDRAAELT